MPERRRPGRRGAAVSHFWGGQVLRHDTSCRRALRQRGPTIRLTDQGNQNGMSSASAAGTTKRATSFLSPALSKATSSLSPSMPVTVP